MQKIFGLSPQTACGKEVFTVTTGLYRMLVMLALTALVAVYTTGYLRFQVSVLLLPVLVMLVLGRGLLRFPRLIQAGSFVVMAYSIWVFRSDIPWVVALVEFTSLILILQLQITSDARSAVGVIILSLMIVLAVAAMNVNFLFPLSLFPYLLLLWAILTRIASLRHQKIYALGQIEDPGVKFRILAKPLKIPIVIAAYLLIWISLFYLVPRSDAYGLASETSRRRLQGFNEMIMLGEGGLLEDNPAVIMRIRPTNELTSTSSIIRRLKSKHLRGTSFSSYSNGRWFRNQTRRYYVDLRRSGGEFQVIRDFPNDRTLHQLELILENTDPPVIFLPDQTVVADFDTNYVAVESDYSMFFLGRTSGRRRYLARLPVEPLDVRDMEVDRMNLTGIMRLYLTKVGIDRRIHQLASQIASNTLTINERVQATIGYLQKNCSYSLYEKTAVDIDPALHFLFYSKSGSCEHFATAMTLLLRSMGIAARPVNGYTMGDWNELGGFFTVRQRHAHTWVEVYFPESGWIPFDPSPPAEDFIPDGEVAAFLVWLWEVYEGHWFNLVYNFDQKAQFMGFRKISRFLNSALTGMADFAFSVYFPGLLLLMAAVVLVRWQKGRVRANSWIPVWYQKWCSLQPVERNHWETPAEYHNRLLAESIFAEDKRQDLSRLVELINMHATKNADRSEIDAEADRLMKRIGRP
ncbi:MAG: transglutaminaseTgpA domain-containing protein [Candidatus Rifleibacteriota bacterium]